MRPAYLKTGGICCFVAATSAIAIFTLLPIAAAAQSQEKPGKSIYEKSCASCHDNAEAARAPSLATLRAMRPEVISFALTQGKMQMQAADLSRNEKLAVVTFLSADQTASDDWIGRMTCSADNRTVELDTPAAIAGFGFDLQNHRRLSTEQSGLKMQDFRNLELAWAIGFSKATTMRSQPAVVGSTLFLPVADASQIYAIDISGPPCIKWVYQSEATLRTSAAFGQLSDGRKVVLVGDIATNIHMIDAVTGRRIWKQKVAVFPASMSTGTPVLHQDRVYVPIS